MSVFGPGGSANDNDGGSGVRDARPSLRSFFGSLIRAVEQTTNLLDLENLLLGLSNSAIPGVQVGHIVFAILKLPKRNIDQFADTLGEDICVGTYRTAYWWEVYRARRAWRRDPVVYHALRLDRAHEWEWIESLHREYWETLNSGIFDEATSLGITNGWSFPTRDPIGNRGLMVITPRAAKRVRWRRFDANLPSAHELRGEWQRLANAVAVKRIQLSGLVPRTEGLYLDGAGEICFEKSLVQEPSDDNVYVAFP